MQTPQTIKIEIPNGFEVASFDTKTGEIKFKEKPKEVRERIKTLIDVLEDNGLTSQQFDSQASGLTPDERAYRLAKLIAKSLNEGWTPDWTNHNEYKYFPWFEMNGSSGFRYDDYDCWPSASRVGSRLCFKSRALAEYAGSQFTDVYKIFMTH